MNIIHIMESLRDTPRPFTPEEEAYLDALANEVCAAQNDAQRWHILEREGLNRINIESYGFDADVLETVLTLRRSAMN